MSTTCLHIRARVVFRLHGEILYCESTLLAHTWNFTDALSLSLVCISEVIHERTRGERKREPNTRMFRRVLWFRVLLATFHICIF